MHVYVFLRFLCFFVWKSKQTWHFTFFWLCFTRCLELWSYHIASYHKVHRIVSKLKHCGGLLVVVYRSRWTRCSVILATCSMPPVISGSVTWVKYFDKPARLVKCSILVCSKPDFSWFVYSHICMLSTLCSIKFPSRLTLFVHNAIALSRLVDVLDFGLRPIHPFE